MNGLLDFPTTRLHNVTTADPEKYLLRNQKGQNLVEVGKRLFDVRKKAMRKVFVDDARYGVDSGAFDGVFIDRANWGLGLEGDLHGNLDSATASPLIDGQRALLDDLQKELTNSHMVLAKESTVSGSHDWQVVNSVMVKDAFCSHYKPDKGGNTFNKEVCLEQIQLVQSVSRRPMMTQLRAMGPATAADREFTMACFLVAVASIGCQSTTNL